MWYTNNRKITSTKENIMLVHLVGSRYEIAKNVDALSQLVDIITEEGHSLVHDWVKPEYDSQHKERKEFSEMDWSLLYRESVEAINRADVIIAETSTASFSVGYQVALAVNMKKPTLVLNREGVEKSFFASGIETGIEYNKYTPETVKEILVKFLRENDIATKDMRFNFFIDRPIYNYLRWSALKTGKTKAEILRELVQREIKGKE
ncbi:MAG: hypothetical protein JWP06_911 [Candidatus Saccharibacteria bacterium]|nr:hypothetical protein [Candidatus Saccharibacteria bacterium]